MTRKPTLVFVHGAWQTTEIFSKVITILQPLGYKCVTVPLASVDRTPAVSSMDEDIAIIRSTVISELDMGNNVMTNSHSYGGLPTVCALDGLSAAKRKEAGKSTWVERLTFCTAFVLNEYTSLFSAFPGRFGAPESLHLIGDNCLPKDLIPLFYHDLDPEEAEYWVSRCRPHSIAALSSTTRTVAWRRIPISYLICEDDRTIPVDMQEKMLEDIESEGGVVESERLFVAHTPYINKSEEVAGFLRRAAREKAPE